MSPGCIRGGVSVRYGTQEFHAIASALRLSGLPIEFGLSHRVSDSIGGSLEEPEVSVGPCLGFLGGFEAVAR